MRVWLAGVWKMPRVIEYSLNLHLTPMYVSVCLLNLSMYSDQRGATDSDVIAPRSVVIIVHISQVF